MAGDEAQVGQFASFRCWIDILTANQESMHSPSDSKVPLATVDDVAICTQLQALQNAVSSPDSLMLATAQR